ncbi:MAG: hypothetical protein GF315_09825 [candidate division Zixibacteria bacterium]|nr:hypothetical protein [candidate division Zixibacteria bacterium]
MVMFVLTPLEVHSNDLVVADSLKSVHEYGNALELYRAAVESDSSDVETLLNLGDCLISYAELQPEDNQLPYYEEAYTILRKANRLDSNNADVHFQIARTQGRVALFKGVWSSIGLAKEVKSEVDKALELNPKHDGALHILGRWHREASEKPKIFRAPIGLGSANKEDALRALKEAVKLRPDYINHHLELGKTYISIEKYPEARNQLYIVLNLEPQKPIELDYQKEAKELLEAIEGKI